jgi:hypothetical protein
MKCIGYGEFENKCPNDAAPKGSYSWKRGPFWCERCNNMRIDTISKQFNEISKRFTGEK